MVALLFLLVPVSLLAQQTVPHPRELFGFDPGDDYKLADYTQVRSYYQALAGATDRVHLVDFGQSVAGRPMMLLFISSEENIAQLERWREIAERLARARDVTKEEARRLATEGRAIVSIDAGLHATEVAHAQHAPLLAYRVATDESPEMRRIRENVVLLLMPVINPDGLDVVVNWYRRNLGTPFETTRPPVLYHHYTGHDNNRDWYMLTQPEHRVVSRIWYWEWYPQIIYNHHQTAPFPARIFIPPYDDPVNPHLHPLLVRNVNLVGSHMAKRFEEEDKPGVLSHFSFVMYQAHGARSAPNFHNMAGILSETAHASASPAYHDPEALPTQMTARGKVLSASEPSIFYPNPWRGGWSRLGDAVDYMLTGSMAVLDIAARLKEDWLYNIYKMGRDAIALGEAGGPFAYVVPPEQWDLGEAAELVNVLQRGGIEVHRAPAAFEADGRRYSEGTWVIFAGQAFRPWLQVLLKPQVYPDDRMYAGGPLRLPYNEAGWTLPIQMGVRVDRIERPFEASVVPVDSAIVTGSVTGGASYGWLLPRQENASIRAVNRMLAVGDRVSWAASAFEAGGQSWPAGTMLVERRRGTDERVARLASELGLRIHGVASRPASRFYPMRLPRVGLYQAWTANIEEGWTRWVIKNQYKFAVDTLHDADIRRGSLSKYDVIILPEQAASEILHGNRPGTMPPEYTGGLGVEGASVLKRFVEAGGTLIAVDAATDFAIEQFGLPVRNAVEGLSNDRFFIQGLVGLDVDAEHPLAHGVALQLGVWFRRGARGGSRAFEIARPARAGEHSAPPYRVEVIARYASTDVVRSGFGQGEQLLAGKPAAVRVGLGKGEVILFGFPPHFRGQPRGSFKLLFNAIHGATSPLPVPGEITVVTDGRSDE